MRGVYINLARSPGREAYMEEQSARLGLRLARIEAVDGRAIPEADFERLCPVPAMGKRIVPTELGCFLSHVAAWRDLVASGARYGAVFEDDVCLAEDTSGFLETEDWIPADADLVRLSSSAVRLRLRVEPTTRRNGRGVRRLLASTVDTGGYVIGAAYARRLLAQADRFEAPVDRVLLDPARGAVLYQLDPSIAVQAKWADFDFLSREEARSQVQTGKPPRAPQRFSLAVIPRELDAFRRKILVPWLLPVLQIGRPRSERISIAPVQFRRQG